MTGIQHIPGQTYHGRKGAVKNAFRYSIDYVMCDAEADVTGPGLFGRNRRGLMSLWDADHGGVVQQGSGAAWVRQTLAAAALDGITDISLLAQPRVLGHVFNPVSFWLCFDAGGVLRVVIAEVGNTFGDRHCYLCHHDDLAPITGRDALHARKVFHVSPFQPIAGDYTFYFDITADAVDIRIDYGRDAGGLIATLQGPRQPLTNRGILAAALRRPFGSRRVLALIHWQALKLWWKGATFRPWTPPPEDDVT
ncbi:hypothetical protein SAMN05428995_10165 [Loktanella sp. DSM 29012]|uniref:DUF1365 domain-containing protein n=1 Tax=Loktanella sp. DSM 29012 TaxID=1881056 RepID=UPI0008BDD0B5|nr:DUF1365 domain-containing protein [Loktanella sp. DSM 29012]SEP56129.1 hypothetical protein SAMN05428995_10165 [Loktanella sp. DSM 29012]